MSLLTAYDQRTAWKYEPVKGYFHTAPGLMNKIGPDGSFVPFYGSTVVFRLGEREACLIDGMEKRLRSRLEDTDMLAFPLPAAAAHMTLHDLVSPEKCMSDPRDADAYSREVRESLDRAAAAVRQIRQEFAGRKLRLEADRIVNMVSKSLVLMLRPGSEWDYELLLELYQRFEHIVRLPYPLTPHITLAYFKPGMLDGDKLWQAMESAQVPPEEQRVFTFNMTDLTAQMFRDMQSYTDVQ